MSDRTPLVGEIWRHMQHPLLSVRILHVSQYVSRVDQRVYHVLVTDDQGRPAPRHVRGRGLPAEEEENVNLDLFLRTYEPATNRRDADRSHYPPELDDIPTGLLDVISPGLVSVVGWIISDYPSLEPFDVLRRIITALEKEATGQ